MATTSSGWASVETSLRSRITLAELAERLQLRHHSAVGLANRLVDSRLVARIRDTVDRRQVYLSLTRRGEVVLKALAAAHREQLRHMSPHLAALLKELRR